MDVDAKTTLIVGRNNTAKTSCNSCINTVLEGKAFSYNDYPLPKRENLHNLFCSLWRKKLSYEDLYKDVETISIEFVVDYSLDAKFRRVFSDSFPLILIDEYQDSYKPIVDRFINFFIAKGVGPQFGFLEMRGKLFIKLIMLVARLNTAILRKSKRFKL